MFHASAHKVPASAENQPGQIVNPIPSHDVAAPRADFAFSDHGSVGVLTALSEEAIVWVRKHLPADAPRWAGGIAIESRFQAAIFAGIAADDLVVV